MSGRAEFSRPVPLARIGGEPFRQEIAAGEAERAALARRFGLLALDRLEAKVELVRQTQDTVLLRADYEAAFAQECVVTLDPIEGVLSERFELLFGPPEAEDSAAAIAGEAAAFEPLPGDAIDIGEAVAQEFSLALPPFPRSPDAEIETGAADQAPGPFGALNRLLGPGEGGTQ